MCTGSSLVPRLLGAFYTTAITKVERACEPGNEAKLVAMLIYIDSIY